MAIVTRYGESRPTTEGYVVLAPDMFWRIEPRFERKDESGLGDAMGMVQRFDSMKGVEDIRATHAHLLGNNDAPSMYNEAAATEAWARTLAFFRPNSPSRLPAVPARRESAVPA